MKYRIRYNTTAGQAGRGTKDHVWRVFDETNKEYLCKNVVLLAKAWSEIDPNGHNWNFVIEGSMEINRETSTITIS